MGIEPWVGLIVPLSCPSLEEFLSIDRPALRVESRGREEVIGNFAIPHNISRLYWTTVGVIEPGVQTSLRVPMSGSLIGNSHPTLDPGGKDTRGSLGQGFSLEEPQQRIARYIDIVVNNQGIEGIMYLLSQPLRAGLPIGGKNHTSRAVTIPVDAERGRTYTIGSKDINLSLTI